MGRIGRSFRLMKQSWGVLMKDKELLVLPVFSALVMLIVMASFVVPIALTSDGEFDEESPVTWILTLAFYIVSYTVGIFFQAAIICGANERLSGGDPTLGSALGGAGKHFGRIMMWGVVAGTVGMILRSIQERSEIVGKIVIAIVGVAWTLATFFVVPVIVLEDAPVGTAFKRSWALIKERWGETVIGAGGIGLATFLLMLPLFALCALFVYLDLMVVGIALLVLGVIVVGILSSAMQAIYVTALYRYATVGEASGGFEADDIAHAFREKRKKR